MSGDLRALSLRSERTVGKNAGISLGFFTHARMFERHGKTEVAARDTVSRLSAETTTTKTTITLMMTRSSGLHLSLCFSCVAVSPPSLLSLSLCLSFTHTFRLFARSVIWTARRVAIGPRKGSSGRNVTRTRETTDELGRDRGRRGRRTREGVTVAFQREL